MEILRVENMICLAILAGISVYDIAFHKISGYVLSIATVLAICYTAVQGNWYLSAAGAAVGGGFAAVSRFTREAVGYGDSWLITVLGIYRGIWGLVELLLAAWLLLAAAAAFCLVRKKWSKKAALPMAPFLAIGFLIGMI